MPVPALHYREVAPDPRLAPVVECFWLLEGGAASDAAPEPVLPDGHAELIVHLGSRFEHHRSDNRVVPQPAMLFAGQLTAPMALRATGPIRILGVRFRPAGAAALFPMPQEEMAGRWRGLDDIHPRLANALAQRFQRDDALEAMLPGVERVLGSHLAAPPDPAMAHAAGRIVASGGAESLDRLALETGLGVRQFRRRFLGEVGLSPKRFARIARFQRVFRALERGPHRWAAIAADCGYFDSAHLIRDFREFAGQAPGRLIALADEFTRVFLSARRVSETSNIGRRRGPRLGEPHHPDVSW